ncbi:MAG TPA: hypothetical protein VFD36_29455 [Kofleriaceae bacterium]|nr:hypothetical protein [Kofleriaceae bacterium]
MHARRWLELELERDIRNSRVESLRQQRRHRRIEWWIGAATAMLCGAAAATGLWIALAGVAAYVWICRQADRRQLEIEDELDQLTDVSKAYLVSEHRSEPPDTLPP